jgi:hypothetical protein
VEFDVHENSNQQSAFSNQCLTLSSWHLAIALNCHFAITNAVFLPVIAFFALGTDTGAKRPAESEAEVFGGFVAENSAWSRSLLRQKLSADC